MSGHSACSLPCLVMSHNLPHFPLLCLNKHPSWWARKAANPRLEEDQISRGNHVWSLHFSVLIRRTTTTTTTITARTIDKTAPQSRWNLHWGDLEAPARQCFLTLHCSALRSAVKWDKLLDSSKLEMKWAIRWAELKYSLINRSLLDSRLRGRQEMLWSWSVIKIVIRGKIGRAEK